MGIYLGIDLGSTTTKAILMDEDEEILGRGITNTRSDYHVATAVAENEARINARFTLLRRNLEKDGISMALLQGLEDHFRQEAFRFRLRRLQGLALEKAATEGSPPSLAKAVGFLFRKIGHQLADDPRSAVRLRNSFFRDIAGCGRYLGYIADELNISLDELGPLALKSRRRVTVSSTCTVFAGAEIRERLELGERREDILAGLHRAIVLRAISIVARSGGVNDEFTFTGGVARNPAVVAALTELIEENYGQRTLNIHPDSIYTGAVGAALYARREATP